jgi:hypothetical protein
LSKATKQRDRFLSIPADFTWDELVTVMRAYGFNEMSDGGGSYRCFISSQGLKMFLHKPHPENIVKRYALRQVRDSLKDFGLLFDQKENK